MSSRNGGSGGVVAGLGLPPGPVVGLVAYLVSYLLTFVLAAVDGVTAGGVPTWTVVGWLLYGAHNVSLTGPGSAADPLSGAGPAGVGSTVPVAVYYLVPVVVLVLAGGYVYSLATEEMPPNRAAGVGATVLVGYVVAAVAGTVAFAHGTGGGRVAPDLVTGVVAGLVYPFVFGAIGGAIVATRE